VEEVVGVEDEPVAAGVEAEAELAL